MELLRKVSKFTTSIDEKRNIYILYIRSVLEQSCTVWHSSLTEENSNNLERVQKAAIRIILGKKYTSDYEKNLIKSDLDSLKIRREILCRKFAKNCVANDKTENMFLKNTKKHKMKTKNQNKYEIKHANTTRLLKSSIPYMRRLLNSKN